MKKTITLLFATLFFFACTQTEKTEIVSTPSQKAVTKIYNPISVAFLDDYSGSREEFGIPLLTVNDLQPAIDYIVTNGGSVLFGIIAANSDYTTQQFTIDSKLIPVKPQEPNQSDFSNSFSYYNAKNEYEKNALKKYSSDSSAYQQKVISKVEKFKTDVNKLMEQNHNGGSTDIGGAIMRTINFHRTAIANSKHYTILVSDGIDWVKTPVIEHSNLNVLYFLSYGSNKAQGNWMEVCKPVITPDLETALSQIGIYY